MKRLFLSLWLLHSLPVWAAEDPAPGLKFIENKRQWASQVHFVAQVPGGQMVIEAGRFRYRLVDGDKIQAMHTQSHERWTGTTPEAGHDDLVCEHIVDVTFLGANTHAQPQPFGRSTEYYNYFLGNDSTRWAAGAYAYDGMRYQNFYAGIDLKVYSQGQHLKYDYIVAPGADPTQIASQYDGADRLSLDNGNLIVATSLGDIIERKPYAYQWIGGQKEAVPCAYVLTGNRLTFTFPDGYDACYPLVIDPRLIFSTYSGSPRDNWGSTATPGEHGTLYSAGTTNQKIQQENGRLFPATAGAFQTHFAGEFDITVIKYDSLGHHMLYATYLGGSSGESPHSLLVNKQQELIVLGTTGSTDFPITAGALSTDFNKHAADTALDVLGMRYQGGSDIVLSRISSDGRQLLASTFLGGTDFDGLNATYDNANLLPGTDSELVHNYGDQLRGDLAVDDTGNIYVSTVTASNDFPVTKGTYGGGLSDAVVVKLNATLTKVLWGTYLGGKGTDAAHTLKLDSQGNIFVAGGTTSDKFTGVTGGQQSTFAGDVDGWIAELDPAGQVLQATYTGTNAFDQVYFLDLNETEEVYVYGQTSGYMPITPGRYGRANSGQFVRKFSNDLKHLLFTTTFGSGGGDPDISPTAFLVSDCNTIYMCGWGGKVNTYNEHGWGTNTFNMETTADAYQRTTHGSDFYFIVLAQDASELLYATYMGGALTGTHVDGGTSRFDKQGTVYHAVCAGCAATNHGTAASDFPTTRGTWSRTNNSLNCNNAAFKFDLSSLKARLELLGSDIVCLPDGFKFRNLSSGGRDYYWDFGDGTKTQLPDTAAVNHTYQNPGEYTISLVAYDPATCITSDTAYVSVKVFLAQASIQDDDHLCGGSSYQLHAEGAAAYHWYSQDGTFTSSAPTPVVKPAKTIRYFVDITEYSGCTHTDSVLLDVTPEVHPDFDYTRTAGCLIRPYVTVHNTTDSLMAGDEIIYDFGDGIQTHNVPDIDHLYERDSLYTIKQTIQREGCQYTDKITLPIFSMTVPNVITPGNKDGDNDYFVVRFGRGQDIKTPADYGFNTSLVVYDRWGKEVYRNPEYHFDWSAEGLASGVYYFQVEVAEHATCKSWIHVIK